MEGKCSAMARTMSTRSLLPMQRLGAATLGNRLLCRACSVAVLIQERPSIALTVLWSLAVQGSYYGNPVLDTPCTDAALMQQFPAYCRPNVWPHQHLPQLREAFRCAGQASAGVLCTDKWWGHLCMGVLLAE